MIVRFAPHFDGMQGSRRDRRAGATEPLGFAQHRVLSRAQLRALGITRFEVRTEVAAGRWVLLGPQAVALHPAIDDVGRRWAAVINAGKDARLDGVSALLQAGLSTWRHDVVDVSVPHGTRPRPLPGVRVHAIRHLEPALAGTIPRTRPELAALRAAQWSESRRQAATLLAMTVQQRLTTPGRLQHALSEHPPWRDARFIRQVVGDVCDGAHSLGELDFTRLCREYGLPSPDHQVVRRVSRGVIYLDIRWPCGLVVEVDGSAHHQGLAPIDDQLRQNEVVLGDDRVLRICLLGLRLAEAEFMSQVRRGLCIAGR